ncbi:uncharacterized protein MONBRDRAFT_12482 [Monosiga brevicollis MX1]|uniref:J domain-containing protein n=1 Tax=Monosiga brevicollis TaxID=81824 RepID=A9VCE5_MONBE|nr:uncharacterized protein MONBRDRAFT_12482 [Monosiga brevicollis MX1]EDQ84771.1 predicted protein [Monosiga brevicollis MX1]|eukprot:XP_001750421.1 hypothetical protein [Monosiga brevicollis MX1]
MLLPILSVLAPQAFTQAYLLCLAVEYPGTALLAFSLATLMRHKLHATAIRKRAAPYERNRNAREALENLCKSAHDGDRAPEDHCGLHRRLGVASDATAAEIECAYNRCLQDVEGQPQEREALDLAHQILTDPVLRQAYDQPEETLRQAQSECVIDASRVVVDIFGLHLFAEHCGAPMFLLVDQARSSPCPQWEVEVALMERTLDVKQRLLNRLDKLVELQTLEKTEGSESAPRTDAREAVLADARHLVQAPYGPPLLQLLASIYRSGAEASGLSPSAWRAKLGNYFAARARECDSEKALESLVAFNEHRERTLILRQRGREYAQRIHTRKLRLDGDDRDEVDEDQEDDFVEVFYHLPVDADTRQNAATAAVASHPDGTNTALTRAPSDSASWQAQDSLDEPLLDDEEREQLDAQAREAIVNVLWYDVTSDMAELLHKVIKQILTEDDSRQESRADALRLMADVFDEVAGSVEYTAQHAHARLLNLDWALAKRTEIRAEHST